MNILVLAPHPDDEAIGCGGTLYQHAQRGDRVVVVFLTSGELGLKHLPREEAWRIRESEAKRAAKILRVAATEFLRLPDGSLGEHVREAGRQLQAFLKREKADLLSLPHPGEWHPDHQAALPVFRKALDGSGTNTPQLRGYEVWTPLSTYDFVEDISSAKPQKLRVIHAPKSQGS